MAAGNRIASARDEATLPFQGLQPGSRVLTGFPAGEKRLGPPALLQSSACPLASLVPPMCVITTGYRTSE